MRKIVVVAAVLVVTMFLSLCAEDARCQMLKPIEVPKMPEDQLKSKLGDIKSAPLPEKEKKIEPAPAIIIPQPAKAITFTKIKMINGGSLNLDISVDGKYVCRAMAYDYCVAKVTTGRHYLSAKSHRNEEVAESDLWYKEADTVYAWNIRY